MDVWMQEEHLPALKQVPVSLGGRSRYGNNDLGRHLRANRERTAWRLVDEQGKSLGAGLFVSEAFATAYAVGRGWRVRTK